MPLALRFLMDRGPNAAGRTLDVPYPAQSGAWRKGRGPQPLIWVGTTSERPPMGVAITSCSIRHSGS